MLIPSYILIFLVIYADIPTAICHGDIGYGNTQSLGISCFPQDSCKLGQAEKCRCDEHCALYGDCCADSPYRNNRRSNTVFTCQKQREYSLKGVYVKSICPRHNVDVRVRQNCERNPSSNDIELKVPVFSLHSSITYRNYYCAKCNNDQDNLLFWDVVLSCNSNANEKVIMENLVYNDEEGWGYWSFSNGRGNWVSCTLSPQLSPKISHYRECSSAMVSECHFQWRNNIIRNMCSLYESRLISKNGKTYKNVHCALCNNVDVEDLMCGQAEDDDFALHEQPGYFSFAAPRGIITINFRDLIDINLKKGNRIEKLNECPEGHVYDEAFRRCAEVFCIGNRVPRGGKCVVA